VSTERSFAGRRRHAAELGGNFAIDDLMVNVASSPAKIGRQHGGKFFNQKLRATLEKGTKVLTAAAQAERERLRQAEELRKAQELKHRLRPRGPSMGR